ncbi:VOC family protein [Marinobacterium jannaschii]|uniref:VOC family protein n=1 Tax=Marinobacterium jannaschii TaxID=64970 RepID=UPI000485FD2B|nr:VOC family protein [Marinobacterium jannaschii]
MKQPKLIGSAAILLVKDVLKSAAYYEETMGFKAQIWGEPPCFSILQRDNCHMMLSETDQPEKILPHYKVVQNMWNVYFWVDDVESLYAEFKAKGARIDYELCDQPYGCREFGIQDLDGYDIAFGQEMDD